jgi:hypothetical protein
MATRALTTTQRGYGHQHQVLRKRVGRLVAEGRAYCTRCGRPIIPGTPWDLDHADHDRSRYRGPSHRRCNQAAARQRAAKPLPPQPSAAALAWFDT